MTGGRSYTVLTPILISPFTVKQNTTLKDALFIVRHLFLAINAVIRGKAGTG